VALVRNDFGKANEAVMHGEGDDVVPSLKASLMHHQYAHSIEQFLFLHQQQVGEFTISHTHFHASQVIFGCKALIVGKLREITNRWVAEVKKHSTHLV